jgi:hypothetical protein
MVARKQEKSKLIEKQEKSKSSVRYQNKQHPIPEDLIGGRDWGTQALRGATGGCWRVMRVCLGGGGGEGRKAGSK